LRYINIYIYGFAYMNKLRNRSIVESCTKYQRMNCYIKQKKTNAKITLEMKLTETSWK